MLYPTAEAGWRIMTHLAMVLCRSCYKMLGHPAPHIHVLDRHSVFIHLSRQLELYCFYLQFDVWYPLSLLKSIKNLPWLPKLRPTISTPALLLLLHCPPQTSPSANRPPQGENSRPIHIPDFLTNSNQKVHTWKFPSHDESSGLDAWRHHSGNTWYCHFAFRVGDVGFEVSGATQSFGGPV